MVIHGGNLKFRIDVAEVLKHNSGEKVAVRYALCGRGDLLTVVGSAVRVACRGCGHRLCPRCSRKRGAKYARRIIEHLARSPHGWLYHVTLTQRVFAGEGLADTKARFERRLRPFLRRLRAHGLASSMVTIHIVWSESVGGWHYHAHLMLDVDERKSAFFFCDMWCGICLEDGERVSQVHTRIVAEMGGAIESLENDDGDADLWSEVSDDVGRAVQYPIRDMAQGASMWKLGSDTIGVQARAVELVRVAKGWKVHRCWGIWRTAAPEKCVAADDADSVDEGKNDSLASPGSVSIGVMDRVFWEARGGKQICVEALRALERTVRYDGPFAKRLVEFVRACTDRHKSGGL